MIQKEEVRWLFRCILGREPENEQIVDAMASSYADFSTARRSLMASEEAQMRRGRHIEIADFSSNEDTVALNNSLKKLDILNSIAVGEGIQERLTSGQFDCLRRIMSRRFRAQTAAVFGGQKLAKLALSILRDCAIRPFLLVKGSSNTHDPVNMKNLLETDRSSCISGLHIYERDERINAVLSDAASVDLKFDVIFVAGAEISCHDLCFAYERLNHAGVVIIDLSIFQENSRSIFIAAAEALHVDIVEVDNFGLLQKTAWMLPVHYIPEHSERLPPPSERPSLAIAAIVKNEAAYIERMLNSVIGIASFVAIADTGSNDDTRERTSKILTSAGTPFCIKDITFINFAQARNAALDLVPANIEWILMLDADEHLVAEDLPKLVQLTQSEVEGWALPRYNFVDERKIEEPIPYPDRQYRLIRNRKDHPYRYSGNVHETVQNVSVWGYAPANMSYLGRGSGGPHIHHMGQVGLTLEKWHVKNDFYSSLFRVERDGS
ncbi:glycosyltransferase [Methylobacterium sp. Gmos1]